MVKPVDDALGPIKDRGEGRTQIITAVDIPIGSTEKELISVVDHTRLNNDEYRAYAVFLLLSTDKEIIEYLNNCWSELNLLSGSNCLVLSIQTKKARAKSEKYSESKLHLSEREWKSSIRSQIENGYTIGLAHVFGVSYTELPCLVVFKELRPSEYVTIALKDLTTGEIRDVMREVFSVIQQSVAASINPVIDLKRKKRRKKFIKGGKSIIGGVKPITISALTAYVLAWIKSVINF